MALAIDSSSTAYQAGQLTGLAFALVLAVYVIHRAMTRGFGSKRRPAREATIALIATLIAGAYLISGVQGGMFESTSSANASGSGEGWSDAKGAEVRAGFLAGCSQSVQSREAICECVFSRISALPDYNTPRSFETLAASLASFQQTHQISSLPAAMVSAIRSCAAAHT